MLEKDVTQTQQQRPGSPRVTLTCLCHSVTNRCHSVINSLPLCYKSLPLCYKSLWSCQQYLADLMHIPVPSYQLRSPSDEEIFTHISIIHNQRQWTKIFFPEGPCLLNKLHGNMSIFFYFAFRTHLKSHFFKQ